MDSEAGSLFRIVLAQDGGLTVNISTWLLLAVVALAAILLIIRAISKGSKLQHFEVDEASIGTGSGTVRLKPNLTDRQIAYAIWVELTTRKIGLEIDLDNDVIVEIYDSWYQFFSITRDLLKDLPVQKARKPSTRKIVSLSIDVLNEGLRPHLTRWQARFRSWYEWRINNTDHPENIDPQELQKEFPQYSQLVSELEEVNKNLINYRKQMYELATNG